MCSVVQRRTNELQEDYQLLIKSQSQYNNSKFDSHLLVCFSNSLSLSAIRCSSNLNPRQLLAEMDTQSLMKAISTAKRHAKALKQSAPIHHPFVSQLDSQPFEESENGVVSGNTNHNNNYQSNSIPRNSVNINSNVNSNDPVYLISSLPNPLHTRGQSSIIYGSSNSNQSSDPVISLSSSSNLTYALTQARKSSVSNISASSQGAIGANQNANSHNHLLRSSTGNMANMINSNGNININSYGHMNSNSNNPNSNSNNNSNGNSNNNSSALVSNNQYITFSRSQLSKQLLRDNGSDMSSPYNYLPMNSSSNLYAQKSNGGVGGGNIAGQRNIGIDRTINTNNNNSHSTSKHLTKSTVSSLSHSQHPRKQEDRKSDQSALITSSNSLNYKTDGSQPYLEPSQPHRNGLSDQLEDIEDEEVISRIKAQLRNNKTQKDNHSHGSVGHRSHLNKTINNIPIKPTQQDQKSTSPNNNRHGATYMVNPNHTTNSRSNEFIISPNPASESLLASSEFLGSTTTTLPEKGSKSHKKNHSYNYSQHKSDLRPHSNKRDLTDRIETNSQANSTNSHMVKQYGKGQYGKGQNGKGQYGKGQYGKGQYGKGQYSKGNQKSTATVVRKDSQRADMTSSNEQPLLDRILMDDSLGSPSHDESLLRTIGVYQQALLSMARPCQQLRHYQSVTVPLLQHAIVQLQAQLTLSQERNNHLRKQLERQEDWMLQEQVRRRAVEQEIVARCTLMDDRCRQLTLENATLKMVIQQNQNSRISDIDHDGKEEDISITQSSSQFS